MSKLIDLTGKRFGMLEVIRKAPRTQNATRWECKCDCGNVSFVTSSDLRNGRTKSCGCLRGIVSKQKAKTHGMSKSKLYCCWTDIKQRCYNENSPAFKQYGGRGIKMCDEWKKSFERFSDWATNNGYSEGLTIERVDVNGNYCPENCKWASPYEQSINRRSNIIISYNGESRCLSEWCKKYRTDYCLVYNRMHKNKWSFERAMFESKHSEKRNKKAKERSD